jgi:hypothetical protein
MPLECSAGSSCTVPLFCLSAPGEVTTELDLPALKKGFEKNEFEAREIRKHWIPGDATYVYECRRLIDEDVRGETTLEAGQE